jgi:hypothetical protein
MEKGKVMTKFDINKLLFFYVVLVGAVSMGNQAYVAPAPREPIANVIEVPEVLIVSDFTCHEEEK